MKTSALLCSLLISNALRSSFERHFTSNLETSNDQFFSSTQNIRYLNAKSSKQHFLLQWMPIIRTVHWRGTSAIKRKNPIQLATKCTKTVCNVLLTFAYGPLSRPGKNQIPERTKLVVISVMSIRYHNLKGSYINPKTTLNNRAFEIL